MRKVLLFFVTITLLASSAAGCTSKNQNRDMTGYDTFTNESKLDTATFGAGCFWCVEAIFQQLRGVMSVVSGYSGGHVKNPSYKEVCAGTTGHAEVCQVIFNKDTITYDELLEVFFLIHDPTSLNKQGNDVGTQYRSSIFYHNQEQYVAAREYIEMLESAKYFESPIVTTLEPFTNFFKAEVYHQDYYVLNTNAPYCMYVISPKLRKFKSAFKDKIKAAQPLN
jgi:peptide-methionine (S)-S-oxide reductase